MNQILLAIILLELPLQIDKYFFYRYEIAKSGTIAGLNVSITTICLVILYCQWLPKLVIESKFPSRDKLRWNWSLTAYLAVVAFSVLMATDRVLSVFQLAMLFQAFLLYIYIANHTRSRDDVIFVLRFLVLGLAIQGAMMLLVQVMGSDISLGPFEVSRDPRTLRMEGTLGSPILAASCLAMLITCSTGILFISENRRDQMLALAAAVLGGLGLILTQSRGAWVGTTLTCSCLMFLIWRHGWLPKRLALTMITCGALAILVFNGPILERIFGDDKGSAESRIPLAKMALQMISDNPFGIGVNNCATVARTYHGQTQFREHWFYTIHNKYLLVCAELGIHGAVVFLGVLVGMVATSWAGWKKWLHADPTLAVASLSICLAILGQMLHMSVDVFASRPQIQILWLLASVASAIHAIPLQETEAVAT